MTNKYKYIFYLILFCVGAGALGYLYFAPHWSFELIKNNETPKFITETVRELNRSLNLKDKKYRIYSAGFGVFDKIPKLAGHQQNAILWLGSKAMADLSNIGDYDLVLAASPFVLSYLEKNDIKAFLEPVGFVETDVSKIFSGDEWVVIGNPPFIEETLKKKNIPFKKYSWDDVIKNPSLVHYVKAIATEDPFLDTHSAELPSVLLNLSAAGIPILAQWKGERSVSLLYQFNDNVSFYLYKDDAINMVDEINEMSDDIRERVDLNKEFTHRYFSLKKAAQNIKNLVLYGKPMPYEYDKNSLSISLRTTVGHYGGGEYWLAQDIKDYMEKEHYLGHIVFENSFYDEVSEINLRLRGPVYDNDLRPHLGTNILWQIYPEGYHHSKKDYLKDLILAAKGNDAVIVASKDIALMMQDKGYNAHYLPQFTNTERFYRDVDERLESEVLFVGNYHFRRVGIVWAIKQGIPVTIYGDKYPEGMAKAKYVDNRILRKYYSSAKIVLNDTMPLMRELGFISNRIFDTTACGSLVISDYSPEIEEIYGDSVPMYKTPEELVHLVQYYLAHDDERERLAKKAQQITLQNFSADKVLKQLYDTIERTKQGIK